MDIYFCPFYKTSRSNFIKSLDFMFLLVDRFVTENIILCWLHNILHNFMRNYYSFFFLLPLYMTEKERKNEKKLYCKKCDFECRYKSDWARHLGTSKHNMATEEAKSATEEASPPSKLNMQTNKKNVCENCNKQYQTRGGLWKHSQNCFKKIIPDTIDEEFILSDKVNATQVMLSLIKDNAELKAMMVEQNNKIINLMAAQPAPVTNITNNTNTINNQFNLNVFLNETCRDAMNINEFIENIEIQMKELEFVANNGYVAGITDIILTRLKQLDISKRPVHCTDLKRETLYVKDANEWNKDTTDNSKIKNMITKVAKKNYRQIPKWREQNPECQNPENEKYDFCINMMRNSLGELGDEQIKLDDKIMKNIAKVVVVDKSQ